MERRTDITDDFKRLEREVHDLRTQVALLSQAISVEIRVDMSEIKSGLSKLVTLERHMPLEYIVYGAIGTVALGALGSALSLIMIKG